MLQEVFPENFDQKSLIFLLLLLKKYVQYSAKLKWNLVLIIIFHSSLGKIDRNHVFPCFNAKYGLSSLEQKSKF